MQTLKSNMHWAGQFDDPTSGDVSLIADHDGRVAGWWLVPSVIGGAAFWIWAFSNLLA